MSHYPPGDEGGELAHNEFKRHEVGLFMWYDGEGHRAFGCAFPSGDVAIMWDRESWPPEEQLNAEHMSIYGTVGDVLHANGGELEWGHWDE